MPRISGAPPLHYSGPSGGKHASRGSVGARIAGTCRFGQHSERSERYALSQQRQVRGNWPKDQRTATANYVALHESRKTRKTWVDRFH